MVGATALSSKGMSISNIPETFNSDLLNEEEQAFYLSSKIGLKIVVA